VVVLVPAPTPDAPALVIYTSAPLTWWSIEDLWQLRRHTCNVPECELRRATVGLGSPRGLYKSGHPRFFLFRVAFSSQIQGSNTPRGRSLGFPG